MSPILDPHSLECFSHSQEQTQRLGARLGELLRPGDLVCLEGELGAGKTQFAQGVGRGWGVLETLTSPTFTLISEYQRPRDGAWLYHVDLYRIASVEEAIGFGLEDYLDDDALILVEWPERVLPLLPEERLWIQIEMISGTKRLLRMQATGERYQALLRAFRERAFGV